MINIKNIILNILSTIIVNMIVIILADKLFNSIFIENIFYTFLVAVLLMILNKCVKPLLKIFMLPLNLLTLGITYPIINVIILSIISMLLGNHFIVKGFINIFFISIFISIMTIIIDKLIGKEIRKVRL